ncbi:MAG: rRNA maturation RNase YbeY [Firmicutes bacterium]|nr:rRNA maturation RNase YbeY [Bacillota bacterium]MCL5039409.1 rRNA maturation RNase YbeY [Bacillota bacterium]
MQVTVNSYQDKLEISPELEELAVRVARRTLQEEKAPPQTEVAVTFVDDQYIQELNYRYRGRNEPTDVLSFSMRESVGEEPFPPEESNLLGDVIISLERAGAQAAEYGHSLAREVGFLTVHGILHLLGYDHGEEAGEGVMYSRQEEILQVLGLKR